MAERVELLEKFIFFLYCDYLFLGLSIADLLIRNVFNVCTFIFIVYYFIFTFYPAHAKQIWLIIIINNNNNNSSNMLISYVISLRGLTFALTQ